MAQYKETFQEEIDSSSKDPNESEYFVGDLLWSKIGNYPFWPCMVSYDPLQHICRKMKSRGKSKCIIYHVQYFGEKPVHGWTSPGNVLLFEGRHSFEALANSVEEAMSSNCKQTRPKHISKYMVQPSQIKKWNAAVQEAEMALKLDRGSRIENFTFKYTMPKRNSALVEKNLKNVGLRTDDHSKGNNSHRGVESSASDKDSLGTCIDQICKICEKTECDTKCIGPCLQFFHSDCLGIVENIHEFKCDECVTEKHSCFHCKIRSEETSKCSVENCGKYYHAHCLENYPLADKRKFICPLHFCLSCFNDNPRNSSASKGRFVRCFRCPIAYHAHPDCIAAGCHNLSRYTVLCPMHFTPTKGRPFQTVINASWCFICGEIGKLICCESCPSSFHVTCLGIDTPEEKYYCEECLEKKFPRYNDIIWVKLGRFRWWPASVKNPKDLPPNILNLEHSVGEFAIQFFGSQEYFWTHRGRVYYYNEGDNFSGTMKTQATKSSLTAKYKASLKEAAEAYEKLREEKLKREVIWERKPPPYKHIKSNKPIGSVSVRSCDINSLPKCTCKPNDEQPCGYDSSCINRSTLVECHPSVCPAGQLCQNQQFQKRQYAPVVPFRTHNRGWALKSRDNIKCGQFIAEYVGDLIDMEECERRMQENYSNNDNNFYFLTMDKDRIIDAGPKGNFSRFMNHSCQPNCETQKWQVNGDIRIGLFAKHDILAGTELTFDYLLDSLGNVKMKCHCGTPMCRGEIGLKRNASQLTSKGETRISRKRMKKQASLVEAEKSCFVCKKDSSVIKCCLKSCQKEYHTSCLGLANVPKSGWKCLRHICNICGNASKHLCSQCTRSYCENHKTLGYEMPSSGLYVCSSHENLDDKKMVAVQN